MTLIFDLL